MAERRRTWLIGLLGACVAAVLVWLVSGELAWPARAMTTFLVAVLPLLLADQMTMAQEIPEAIPRPLLYRLSALALWLLAVLTALAGIFGGLTRAQLGLQSLSTISLLSWAAVVIAGGLGVLFVARALGMRETALLRFVLPRTRAERLEFVGLAITAGITEEVVFRGFLITALNLAGGGWVLSTVISSALFGYAHGYQGPAGILRGGILGLLLALPFLATGSLLPSMVGHAALDLIAGIWLADRLVGGGSPNDGP